MLFALLIGENDPRRTEIAELQHQIVPDHLAVLLFHGGHQWAPADVFAKALSWIESRAGRVNRRILDPIENRQPLTENELGRTSAGNQKNYSADDADAADDRSDRHRMFFVLVNFKRTQFRHVLFCGETGVAAVSKHDDTDDDQNDSQESSRLHNIEYQRRSA